MGTKREANGQVIAIWPHDGCEETDLLYAMTLPDAEGVILEAGEEVGEPAWEGGVDAEFDDHCGWWVARVRGVVWRSVFLAAKWEIAYDSMMY